MDRGELIEVNDCDICGGSMELHRDDHGEIYWNGGHNAWPVAEGRCCDGCHMTVMAARFRLAEERAQFKN